MVEADKEPTRPDETPILEKLLAAIDDEAPAVTEGEAPVATEEYPLVPDTGD